MDLVERLDGFPLALTTAGLCLKEVAMSCKEYIEQLEENWLLLHETTPGLQAYDRTLYSSWNISYEHIKSKDPAAAMLLRLWGFFAKEDVWYELLHKDDDALPGWLAGMTQNKILFHASMRLLCTYGLVEPRPPTTSQGPESQGYSVHECVHSWMIHVLNEDDETNLLSTAIKCLTLHIPKDLDDANTWHIQRRLLAHADWCRARKPGTSLNYETMHLLNDLSSLYQVQARTDDAEQLQTSLIVNLEEGLGRNDELTLNAVRQLGEIYSKQGRYKESKKAFERALKGYKQAFGPEHESVLEIISDLGDLYVVQPNMEEDALAMYHRVLQGMEKTFGPNHTKTLNIVRRMGYIYDGDDQPNKAEEFFKRALKGYKATVGPKDDLTLTIYNNLGEFYLSQGQYDKAKAMHQRALRGYETTLGTEHSSTCETYLFLGHVYRLQERSKKAMEFYDKAVRGLQKGSSGPTHPFTLKCIFFSMLSICG